MKKSGQITEEELFRRIALRPFWTFFHAKFEFHLKEAMQATGEDALKGFLMIGKGLLVLAVCAAAACKHITMILLYPMVKIYFQTKCRKAILEKHPEYTE